MATNKTNKANDCLSEVPFSFSHEESRENSCSFTSREMKRSFPRTACKIRQEDKGSNYDE